MALKLARRFYNIGNGLIAHDVFAQLLRDRREILHGHMGDRAAAYPGVFWVATLRQRMEA